MIISEHSTRTATDYTPAEIRAMQNSSSNRGLLAALSRYGNPSERQAADHTLTAWNKAAFQAREAARQAGESGDAAS